MPLTQVSSRLIEDTLRYVLGASGTNHYTFTGKGLMVRLTIQQYILLEDKLIFLKIDLEVIRFI